MGSDAATRTAARSKKIERVPARVLASADIFEVRLVAGADQAPAGADQAQAGGPETSTRRGLTTCKRSMGTC